MNEFSGGLDTDNKSEELCRLFSSTVSSLSADTEALKQLLCLKQMIAINDMSTINRENMEPNRPNERRDAKVASSNATIVDLFQIDNVVTDLENKLHDLREIVAEEQRALKKLESVKIAAEAQKEVLEYMVEECRDVPLPGDSKPSRSRKSSLSSRVNISQRESTVERAHPQRRDQMRNSLSIRRVSVSEFNNVPRTLRGRVTLMDINGALEDIENVCKSKYDALYHHKKSAEQLIHCGRSQHIMASAQDRQQVQRHYELLTEEHEDLPWVAEVDLRHSCAFFRIGESTARAILSVLRSLKRLKQVPGKKTSEVTYIVLGSK